MAERAKRSLSGTCSPLERIYESGWSECWVVVRRIPRLVLVCRRITPPMGSSNGVGRFKFLDFRHSGLPRENFPVPRFAPVLLDARVLQLAAGCRTLRQYASRYRGNEFTLAMRFDAIETGQSLRRSTLPERSSAGSKGSRTLEGRERLVSFSIPESVPLQYRLAFGRSLARGILLGGKSLGGGGRRCLCDRGW